jgi:hypothetical protein
LSRVHLVIPQSPFLHGVLLKGCDENVTAREVQAPAAGGKPKWELLFSVFHKRVWVRYKYEFDDSWLQERPKASERSTGVAAKKNQGV